MPHAENVLNVIKKKLEDMICDDETITVRAVIRRLDGILGHPSDITRISERNLVVKKYQARQSELRAIMEKVNKNSKTNLTHELAVKTAEIETLKRQRAMLIASHRAMILAVGEVGGMRAWRRFYENYQSVIDELREMGAMPDTQLLTFSSNKNEDD